MGVRFLLLAPLDAERPTLYHRFMDEPVTIGRANSNDVIRHAVQRCDASRLVIMAERDFEKLVKCARTGTGVVEFKYTTFQVEP